MALKLPKTAPLPNADPTLVPMHLRREYRVEWKPDTWQDICSGYSTLDGHTEHSTGRANLHHLVVNGDPGKSFPLLAHATEQYLLHLSDIPSAEWRNYEGRGRLPKPTWRPIVHRCKAYQIVADPGWC